MVKKVIRIGYIFLFYMCHCFINLSQSLSGTTNGVSSVNGRKAAVDSVNSIAKIINTFSFAIFIMVIILGVIIGLWNMLKHTKNGKIELDEILIVWCQVLIIVFMCGIANKIANYIASNGYTIEAIIR